MIKQKVTFLSILYNDRITLIIKRVGFFLQQKKKKKINKTNKHKNLNKVDRFRSLYGEKFNIKAYLIFAALYLSAAFAGFDSLRNYSKSLLLFPNLHFQLVFLFSISKGSMHITWNVSFQQLYFIIYALI